MANLNFDPGLVIDFGCGVGRLAKEINQPVIGVDNSRSMRKMAQIYVKKETFRAIDSNQLEQEVNKGLRAQNNYFSLGIAACI